MDSPELGFAPFTQRRRTWTPGGRRIKVNTETHPWGPPTDPGSQRPALGPGLLVPVTLALGAQFSGCGFLEMTATPGSEKEASRASTH